jgi:hypothetical protein
MVVIVIFRAGDGSLLIFFLHYPFAGPLFCPWSAHGRHLMGSDEAESLTLAKPGEISCA